MKHGVVWAAVVVGLFGCGDDDSGAMRRDAAVVQQDAPVDAPPILIDAPMPPGDHYHYVIDKVNLPANNNEARAYGLDLNSDGTVDNQLGMVIATFAGMGIQTQPWSDKQVDTGTEIMLADLSTLSFTSAQASTFTIYQGSNPMPAACAGAQDTVCRKHLTGSASFTALSMPVDPLLVGNFVNGTYSPGPGHLTIQIAFPDAPPTQITLIGARVKMSSVSATAVGTAILAGGVTQTDVDGKVIPAMRTGFMAAVTRDCTMLSNPPNCGCGQGSTGKTYINLFDTNQNCDISVQEVRDNSLITSLLAPDITVENKQCLSLGFSTHAVPAGFADPQ